MLSMGMDRGCRVRHQAALSRQVNLCTCAHPISDGRHVVLAVPRWMVVADGWFSATVLLFVWHFTFGVVSVLVLLSPLLLWEKGSKAALARW